MLLNKTTNKTFRFHMSQRILRWQYLASSLRYSSLITSHY